MPSKLISITISLVILFASCSGEMGKNDIIPAQKMQNILIDMQLAEAYSSMVNDSLHQIRNKNKDSLAVYFKSILAHHNTSITVFFKSVDWYKNNPEELDSVYANMIPALSKIEGESSKK